MPRTLESRAVALRHHAQRFGRRQVTSHQRERLVAAALPLAELFHGRRVAGIAGQVESAQPFDGQNLPRRQPPPRLADLRRERRTANRAGVRLRVKPAVGRIVVLAQAIRAQLESGHGGVRPVVGDVADDGVARPAVGAIGERVPVAAVGGVREIAPAGVARRDIRRDERELARHRHAVADRELALSDGGRLADLGFLDPRQRGGVLQNPARERVYRAARALRLGRQSRRGVQHVPAKPQFARQVVDEGPEADALHDPAQVDANAPPRPLLHQRCTRPEPPPLSRAFTSSTVTRLKSPGTECLRQLAATAKSSACW